MKKHLILLAAGEGSRMKSDIPKQFMLLNGEPMLSHSLKTFVKAVPAIEIFLVLPAGRSAASIQIMEELRAKMEVTEIAGGSSRFASVKNALSYISGNGLVAVHDAARPFVSIDLILDAFKTAETHGSAIPGIPVQDSVFYSDGGQTKCLDRKNYFLAQTPQCFQLDLLRDSYDRAKEQAHFTDDAAVFECAGQKIYPIAGDPRNIKITTERDYQLAQLILKK